MAYGNQNTQNQNSPKTSTSENLGTGIDNLPSSSVLKNTNKEFPLLKKIISNQKAKELTEGTFNEVILSEEKFDDTKIKKIYNDLFYQISKKGKKSHYNIIELSEDYYDPSVNENLEDEIEALGEDLLELNKDLLSGSLITFEPSHPIFANGTLIQEGDTTDNAPIEPNSDIWYIQQGFKRRLGRNSQGHINGYWKRLLRQVQGEDVYNADGSYKSTKNSPYFRFLTPEDINSIPSGTDINDGDDLNDKAVIPIDDYYIYSEIKIKLYCKGVEKFYRFSPGEIGYDPDLSGYPNTGGYWYIDDNAYCKVKAVTDEDPSQTFLPKEIWHNIRGGTSKTITISRDAKFYGHTLNGTSDPLDYDFYHETAMKEYETRDEYGSNMDIAKLLKWKYWGEGKLFPAIINVKPGSRLTYRLISPANNSGNVVDGGGSHQFNAVIDSADGVRVQGAPSWQKNMFNSFYNRISNYNTPMLHRNCYGPLGENGCFGALGQSTKTQTLLLDKYQNYYRTSVKRENSGEYYKVYGQPILKVKNKYSVLLRSSNQYTFFYNIEEGNQIVINNEKLDEYVEGYRIYDPNHNFRWMNYFGEAPPDEHVYYYRGDSSPSLRSYMNNPTLYYPGLKGEKLNTVSTDWDKGGEINSEGYQNLINMVVNFMNEVKKEPWAQNHMIQDALLYLHTEGSLISNDQKIYLGDNPFNLREAGSNKKFKFKEAVKYE